MLTFVKFVVQTDNTQLQIFNHDESLSFIKYIKSEYSDDDDTLNVIIYFNPKAQLNEHHILQNCEIFADRYLIIFSLMISPNNAYIPLLGTKQATINTYYINMEILNFELRYLFLGHECVHAHTYPKIATAQVTQKVIILSALRA